MLPIQKIITATLVAYGLDCKTAKRTATRLLPSISNMLSEEKDALLREDLKMVATCPKNVNDYALKKLYANTKDKREKAYILFVGSDNVIKGHKLISVGGFSSTIIDKRVVLKYILDKGVTNIILVHNHPGGNARPSQADIKQTDELRKALSAFDFTLVDHVITGDRQFFSFAEDRLYN